MEKEKLISNYKASNSRSSNQISDILQISENINFKRTRTFNLTGKDKSSEYSNLRFNDVYILKTSTKLLI